jgi:hypothetical protein
MEPRPLSFGDILLRHIGSFHDRHPASFVMVATIGSFLVMVGSVNLSVATKHFLASSVAPQLGRLLFR